MVHNNANDYLRKFELNVIYIKVDKKRIISPKKQINKKKIRKKIG